MDNFIAIAIVSLLAAISPGPDFVIVLKNSLSSSRKAGLMTALGVSTALIFHLMYTLVGLGVLIAESPRLYMFIKYLGAAYLTYIGLCSIIASFKSSSGKQDVTGKQISLWNAFREGFLTNLLNPKAAVFFISLFSQFVDASTPALVRVEYAIINWIITLGWFLLLSYLVTSRVFMSRLDSFRVYLDRVMGSALVFLGLKLMLI